MNIEGNQNTSGNANSATYASAVSTSAENAGTTARYMLFADNNSNSNQTPKTSSGFTYIPSSNALTIGSTLK